MNGFKYVTPCQSQFSRQSIEQILTEQYQNISSIVKNCLQDHRIPNNKERNEKIFSELQHMLYELQCEKIPQTLAKRAQHEYNVVRSIQRRLRQRSDIVIRRTDKNKVFFIGKAADFERKAEEYMLKTEAYEEIANGICPLKQNSNSVKAVLDYLLTKKGITKKLYNQLCPKEDKSELGHFHGLPKPHKVIAIRARYAYTFSFYSLAHLYDQS